MYMNPAPSCLGFSFGLRMCVHVLSLKSNLSLFLKLEFLAWEAWERATVHRSTPQTLRAWC
jgi:hypothetical protein